MGTLDFHQHLNTFSKPEKLKIFIMPCPCNALFEPTKEPTVMHNGRKLQPPPHRRLPGGPWIESASNYSVIRNYGADSVLPLILRARLQNRHGDQIRAFTYFRPGDKFANRDGQFVEMYDPLPYPVGMTQQMQPAAYLRPMATDNHGLQ